MLNRRTVFMVGELLDKIPEPVLGGHQASLFERAFFVSIAGWYGLDLSLTFVPQASEMTVAATLATNRAR